MLLPCEQARSVLSVLGTSQTTYEDVPAFTTTKSLRPATLTRRWPCVASTHRHFSSTRTIREEDSHPTKADLRKSSDISNLNIHPDLGSHLRQIMRRVPHSVVVITSSVSPQQPSSSHPAGPEAAFRGMTCSSFNTVSLSPPLVSFNIRLPSASYLALKSSGTFLVHLLRANEAGARICDTFAKGNDGGNKAFERLVAHGSVAQVFSGKGSGDAPLLAGNGVMKVLRCKVRDEELRIGDHVVVVGEVLSIVGTPVAGTKAAAEDDMGLVYAERDYHALGQRAIRPLSHNNDERPSSEPVQQTTGLGVRRGDEGLA